ncbi:hypothetical protein EGT74_22450 [Chitinophaga lutea]|uniref:Uncharacterized protein n=1 Tax=Chitinophaga lutea TaxID=2488634 RepID=A0A3N4PNJ1_9BACT|nr:hypothetical protein EGT74_22450 [Chitinophaga lutea]
MIRLLKYEYLYLIPLLLSAIFGLKTLRQKWPKQYRLLALLVIISFLTEIFAIAWKWHLYDMFPKKYARNNFWIYNIFITVRFGILLTILYRITHSLHTKKTILYAGPVLLLFGLLNYFFIQGPYQYNTYSVIFAHIPIIVLCLLYLKQLLEETGQVILHKEPMVWALLGTFVYHAASLPFLVILNFLNSQQQSLSIIYLPINDTLNLLLCTFYLISFLCKPLSTRLY